MSHQISHADTPKVVYLYEDVPKEALKSASARLKGSAGSKWAPSTPSRARNSTKGSSGDESNFVYPGNDLAANIEKADGFYDSTWKPLNAGENVATMKEDSMGEKGSSNAIPVSSNHNRTSSWITMDSDGHPAQVATNVSAYTPTPSYHSPSPSSTPMPLPLRDSIADTAPSAEPEDPWAAWTSGNTTITGEDAYLSRKSISSPKGSLPPPSPASAKVDSPSSIHATRGAAVRGTSGRGRGRGRADLLSIKGSSANRAKSPVQTLSESSPSSAEISTLPSSLPISDTAGPSAKTNDADPWTAWAPASNAITGEAARKAREIATKAGKAIVEKNIVKPPSIPAPTSARPPVPFATNGDHSKGNVENGLISSIDSQGTQDQTVKSQVKSGWTTIDTDTPPPRRAPSPIQSSKISETLQVEASQVHDQFSQITLESSGHSKVDVQAARNGHTRTEYTGMLVDLAEPELANQSPVLSPGSALCNPQQKIHSPSSSFASFHSIEDDGMANIPVLKPSSSSSQSATPAIQHNGTSSPPAVADTITVLDDRQVVESKLRDIGYAGSDVSAIAGLLCSLPKSNLRKCLADTAFLRRKAEEAMRILQADDEEEEEL